MFADLVLHTRGGGLSTVLMDKDYPLLCVDLLGQRVGLCDVERYDDYERIVDPHDMSNWRYVLSFKEFCDIDLASTIWGWWCAGPDPALNWVPTTEGRKQHNDHHRQQPQVPL